MAGMHFDFELNSEPANRRIKEIQQGFNETAKAAELAGGRIDAAFEKISLKSLERMQEIMKNFPKEVQGISSFQKQIDGLEKHIERVNQRIASVGNGKLGSTFSDVSGNVNIGNVLKEQVYVGAQAVNTLSEKIIQQKILIKDVEHDVRTLGEAYKRAGEGTTKGNALFADFKSAKKSLQEEKNALFELQTQQAQARLSVRKLKDEQSLYQKEAQKVVESNEKMSVSFKKALGVIGGTAMLKKFVSDVVRVRGEMQQLDVAFTTLLQSKEKANALMAQMVQTAAKTPFNLTELANGAKQLVAYGFASEGVNDTLIRLGNIAAGLGLPLERLTYLYGTTMTQGRLYARDLMQFTTSGIPMLQGLADMYGVSTDKVNEMVTAGKIGFPEVQKVIENMTNEGGKFFNLMEEQSKTITGKISNLGDAWDEMLNKIGQSQEGTINASIDGLKYLIENYETVGKILTGLIATFGVYKAATIAYYAISKTYGIYDIATKELQFAATMKNIAATKALAVQQALLNKTMLSNPYILVATLVVGAAAAMWAFHDSTTAAEKAQSKFNDELDKFKQKEEERKQKIESLIRTIQDETETEFAKVKAYQELQRLSPALTDAYKREELAVASLADTNKELNKVRDVESYDNIIANIKKYTEYVNRLSKPGDKMKNVGDMYSGMVSEYGVNTTFKDRLELAIEDLKKWQDALDEYKRLKKEAEENAKPVEVKLLEAKNNREQILQEFLSAEMTLKEEQRKIKDSGCGEIPIWVEIRFENAQKALSNINGIIKGLLNGQSNVTYKEAYNTAQREWKKAQKALVESKKKSKAEYIAAKKDLDDKEKAFKDLGGVTNTTKQESASEKLRKEQQKYNLLMDRQSREQIRSTEDLWNEVWQAQIDTMDEGGKKTLAQMELNHEKELQAIDRQREDLLRKKKEQAKAVFNERENDKKTRNPNYVKQTFDGSGVTLDETENNQFDGKYKATLDKQAKDRQAYYASEKQAMNEYLAAYGDYMQKRQAIIDQGEEKKKGKSQWEQKSVDEDTKKLLAGVDDEVQKKTSIITQLFSDMSKRTVADMRLIADQAQKTLDYVNAGEFKTDDSGKGLFGLTKEQFDILSKSPEKLESIKNEIANVRKEADASETALNKLGNGLKKVFSSGSDTKKFQEGLADISEGMNSVLQAGQFLSNSLSTLGDAFGSGTLSGIADGINVAMDAMSSTMDGAKAGAAFGPWGAAAGAAIGMVTSLASSFAKIHDAKNEKRITVLQDQIEVLEKSYDKLGSSIEKAYSKDASKLIDQQNTLLEQQKVLIRNQIAEERDKKKTDDGRIEEWERQIEDINKLIEDNKEKQIDAIFGEDLKSAINNFAQAYTDAWTSGEDKAKSAKETVKNMMRQMVTESIKAAIQSSESMERIRAKLQEFYSDNVLSGWEQDYIYNMADSLQQELDNKFGWADGLIKDEDPTREASQKGIATASQDSVDENNGRLTVMQSHTYSINEGVISIKGSAEKIATSLACLTNIDKRMSDMIKGNDAAVGHLSKIEGYTANLVEMRESMYAIKIGIDTLNTKGLTLKR